MSIKYMAKAWESEAEGNALLVLIALCDYANDDGELYPSLKTICDKTKVCKANLSYILRSLEDIGALERERRKRENGSDTSTLYRILDLDFSVEEYKKSYQKNKGYTPKTPQSEHPKHPKVNTGNSPKVNTQTPQSEHLEPSILNRHKKNTKKKSRHLDLAFKVLITKLRERAKYRSKIKNSDEEYEAYLEISDTKYIFEDYLKHQEEDGKFSKSLHNFLLDYNSAGGEEVVLWA